MTLEYEVFFSHGGSSGPYQSDWDAIRACAERMKGDRRIESASIRFGGRVIADMGYDANGWLTVWEPL